MQAQRALSSLGGTLVTRCHLQSQTLSGATELLVGRPWVRSAGCWDSKQRLMAHHAVAYRLLGCRQQTSLSHWGSPIFEQGINVCWTKRRVLSILKTEILIPLPHQMQQKLDSGCCISQKCFNYWGMSCFEGRRWVMMNIPLYENNFILPWFQQISSVKTTRYTTTSVFVQINIFWPAINLNWKCPIVLLENFLCLPEVFCPIYYTSLIATETVADLCFWAVPISCYKFVHFSEKNKN